MIKQTEIRRFGKLKQLAKQFEDLKEQMIKRMDKEEKQEGGLLRLHMNKVPSHSTAYKEVVTDLVAAHPDLAKEAKRRVKARTKPTTLHYLNVEVNFDQ